MAFRFLTTSTLLAISLISHAQEIDSTHISLTQETAKYYVNVDSKISSINKQLSKKSGKYLDKLAKHERNLERKLRQSNNPHGAGLFAGTQEQYRLFKSQLNTKSREETKIASNEYNTYLDTLLTSLLFLKQFNDIGDKVSKPFNSVNQLQSKLQLAGNIRQYITQRKKLLKDALSGYKKLPRALQKEFSRLNKTGYYYSAQVNEYKAMLKDPSKAEQKLLRMLTKLPAFQKFMKKNGQLASFFSVPDNLNTQQNLTGLQTRVSVQGLIQAKAEGPASGLQIVQQNISQAKDELAKLRDKVNNFGGGSSDIDMPDFKPRTQKTRSFSDRLNFGANVQFEKRRNQLPSSTNIGLSLGYKLDDKSTAGIGVSYKLGMGTIRHVAISNQGIGLRSFADYKIKKSLYVSGGFEMNYNTAFKNMEQLKHINAWQTSGLIGLSKKYKVSKKVQGEMKLLYDFLANDHVPVSQPVLFRLGYHLK